MRTSANIHIKTKEKNIQYTTWMDGGYKTLGRYIFKGLLYKKECFLKIMADDEESNIDDSEVEYIYQVYFESGLVAIFYKGININSEVVDYFENENRDLIKAIRNKDNQKYTTLAN